MSEQYMRMQRDGDGGVYLDLVEIPEGVPVLDPPKDVTLVHLSNFSGYLEKGGHAFHLTTGWIKPVSETKSQEGVPFECIPIDLIEYPSREKVIAALWSHVRELERRVKALEAKPTTLPPSVVVMRNLLERCLDNLQDPTNDGADRELRRDIEEYLR